MDPKTVIMAFPRSFSREGVETPRPGQAGGAAAGGALLGSLISRRSIAISPPEKCR
jgi:hypothetical protein